MPTPGCLSFFPNERLSAFFLSDTKSRIWLCSLLVAVGLICGVYFVGGAWIGKDLYKMRLSPGLGLNKTKLQNGSDQCKDKCRPTGTDTLPEGILSSSSDFELHTLWGTIDDNKSNKSRSLLAIAVGISQKRLVNQLVIKFLQNDFVVMLFHYDGVVDKWHDFEWSGRVIHVSATNQTKWWFAKRFLHPDIVAEYDYVFLWDEDLGVENFHPARFLSIVEEEGLEISQPALDPGKSKVHHPITARKWKSKVHRRYYKYKGSGRCDENNKTPPCVGSKPNSSTGELSNFQYGGTCWVEMMAPVFSRAAWRCTWYMIQNDLIHAWGLDMKLGYCAQGDPTIKVGIVDEEYIVHLGLPTLGVFSNKNETELHDRFSYSTNSSSQPLATTYNFDERFAVRRKSHKEMMIFRSRWQKAIDEDECWIDPFKKHSSENKG